MHGVLKLSWGPPGNRQKQGRATAPQLDLKGGPHVVGVYLIGHFASQGYSNEKASRLLPTEAYASCGSLGSLWVDLEGHGRDGNFAQTVGWFTELQAVQLRAGKPPGAELTCLDPCARVSGCVVFLKLR